MLSDIQKMILCLTLEKRFITCEEILTELWGWKGQDQGTTIDKAQYASAHSSLSRTLTRLWRRGLIEYWKSLTRYRTAISLRPSGKALAHTIKAEAEKSRFNG